MHRTTEKTISEAQSELEAAILCLPALAANLPDKLKPLAKLALPKGFRAQVALRRGDPKESRQVPKNASASCWVPDSGFVAITYRRSTAEEEQAFEPREEEVAALGAAHDAQPEAGPVRGVEAPGRPMTERTGIASDPSRDIVLALAKAEQDPQLGFVSLKWFRDTYLPQQGFAWAAIPDDRQRAMVNAIDRKWILTSKVENPKNPQFPVTAIRVNRSLDEVHGILSQQPAVRSRFSPIAMRGEPLSETVLRERR